MKKHGYDYVKMAKCRHPKRTVSDDGRDTCDDCGLIIACAPTRGMSDQLRQCYGMNLFGDEKRMTK